MADETANLISDAGMRLDPAERRLLAGMPLHAITSVHGEAGLRERLAMEIAGSPPPIATGPGRAGAGIPAARGRPAAARTLRQPPAQGHHPDPEPLPRHRPGRGMRRAAARRRRRPRGRHRPGAAGRRPWRCWPAGSAARTATLVAAVTNPEWEPGRDKHEQYREHVLASLAASPWARMIKASDFTGNAVGMIHTTGPKLSKLTRKYGPPGASAAHAHPAPGHPAGRRRKGPDRRPARRRPGAVRRDRAWPPRRPRG